MNIIPKSIQLIAGRTGREYNQRKIGDKEFVMETKAKLGAKAIGRRELENNERYELKELQSPYNRVFDPEKCSLRLKNDHFWEVS